MAAVGVGRLAPRLVNEAELNRIVTVAGLFTDQKDRARPHPKHGHGSQLTGLIVDLCHAHFQTQ